MTPTQQAAVGGFSWAPTDESIAASQMRAFMTLCESRYGITLSSYRDLWAWSVENVGEFWDSFWQFMGVIGERGTGPALIDHGMPDVTWFPGARVNWAQNVLARDIPDEQTAIHAIDDDGSATTLTWGELRSRVASLAAALREHGVVPGDRVAAVLPNIPEAIIALLASASIGAVWTICSPEVSPRGCLARLAQVEPVVLIGVDSYRYNGREYPALERLREVRDGLPTVTRTLVVQRDAATVLRDDERDFAEATSGVAEATFWSTPFDHPLWIVYSSGTTGSPKGIVHPHGGITLEAMKNFAMQHDTTVADRYYAAANTSWMMWNVVANALLVAGSVVAYSGSPTFPSAARQFEIVAQTRTNVWGVGASYLSLVERSGVSLDDFDFSALRSVQSTGSPLPLSTWEWAQAQFGPSVHLGSDSGGTDVCSGIIGSNPLEPVTPGLLQAPYLGVNAQAWGDDGQRLVDNVGELVITRPMPSMPLGFWNDPTGERYRGSYYARFPGVWAQGDWVLETADGQFEVKGRSDATLNRDGVRLGSADIYSALDGVPEIEQSLVVGLEGEDAAYELLLFVVLRSGVELDSELQGRIAQRIKSEASPRHVPDRIVVAPSIPLSHSGKRLEVPVKRLLAAGGEAPAGVRETVANPESYEWFVEFARERAGGPSSDGGTPASIQTGEKNG